MYNASDINQDSLTKDGYELLCKNITPGLMWQYFYLGALNVFHNHSFEYKLLSYCKTGVTSVMHEAIKIFLLLNISAPFRAEDLNWRV